MVWKQEYTGTMKEYEIKRRLFQREITAKLLITEQGISVLLTGGDLPHIGAVSVTRPEGTTDTIEFPGHREGIVSERWSGQIAALSHVPAVVQVGIHYDHVNREQIAAILQITDEMLEEVSGSIKQLY